MFRTIPSDDLMLWEVSHTCVIVYCTFVFLYLCCFVDFIKDLLSCYSDTITVHFKVYIVPNDCDLLFISVWYSEVVVIDSFNVIMITVSILCMSLFWLNLAS